MRSLVGLGGVMVQRHGTPLGTDVAGDEVAASTLRSLSPAEAELFDHHAPACPGSFAPRHATPTPAAMPTATPIR
jgi:hypothetical protein